MVAPEDVSATAIEQATAVAASFEMGLSPGVEMLFGRAGDLSRLQLKDRGLVGTATLLFAIIERSETQRSGRDDERAIAEVARLLKSDERRYAELRFATFMDDTEDPAAFAVDDFGLSIGTRHLIETAAAQARQRWLMAPPRIELAHLLLALADLDDHSSAAAMIEALGLPLDECRQQARALGLQALERLAAEGQEGGLEAVESLSDPDFASVEDSTPPADRPAQSSSGSSQAKNEAATEFVPDDAEIGRDQLGRSVLAIALARRLHRIWQRTNVGAPTMRDDPRGAFVVHIDAPWGGGKTTFANYLAQVLNPHAASGAHFLRERYGKADLGGIFLSDPPVDTAAVLASHEDGRRPWIVVNFNAWQVEHCSPPWWVFYQTIRQRCFEAVRREGRSAWTPGVPTREGAGVRWLSWAGLWGRELGWRLLNPKVGGLLLTALIGMALLAILKFGNIVGLTGTGDKTAPGFILTNGVGLMLAGLTALSAVWGLASLLTESVMPGAGGFAERMSLGGGDPFQRFRLHFQRTVAAVRRPVLVVVDDLDRCRPDFVVGLVQGMQTLLRSPRVTFVILGDKDWIESAFESHHGQSGKLALGPEQSLGARFVEKAIQMSFILPALGEESQAAYVRHILLGSAAQVPVPSTVASDVRRITSEATSISTAAALDAGPIVDAAMKELTGDPADTRDPALLREQVTQAVNDTLAINAAADPGIQRQVEHELQTLSACFPANPRQIKRIVNAITLYYAVALQRPGLDLDAAFRTQLALWIILMTEWPQSWRLLASCPDLADVIASADRNAALAALPAATLPGSVAATKAALNRIAADARLSGLIRGTGGGAPGLDSRHVRILAVLTPLHRRYERLPEAPRAGPAEA